MTEYHEFNFKGQRVTFDPALETPAVYSGQAWLPDVVTDEVSIGVLMLGGPSDRLRAKINDRLDAAGTERLHSVLHELLPKHHIKVEALTAE